MIVVPSEPLVPPAFNIRARYDPAAPYVSFQKSELSSILRRADLALQSFGLLADDATGYGTLSTIDEAPGAIAHGHALRRHLAMLVDDYAATCQERQELLVAAEEAIEELAVSSANEAVQHARETCDEPEVEIGEDESEAGLVLRQSHVVAEKIFASIKTQHELLHHLHEQEVAMLTFHMTAIIERSSNREREFNEVGVHAASATERARADEVAMAMELKRLEDDYLHAKKKNRQCVARRHTTRPAHSKEKRETRNSSSGPAARHDPPHTHSHTHT